MHYRSLDDPDLPSPAPDGAWLTIGLFDGVHRGHAAIIRRLVNEAHANGGRAVVLTFHPHPAAVLRGRNGPQYLTSPDERAELLQEMGVDVVITEPFTRELAARSAEVFMTLLSNRLGLRRLLVGHDFALGRNREGDLPRLQELGKQLGYTVSVVHPVRMAGEVVSSSRIRTALAEGDVRLARRLLGRPYQVQGKIIPGDGRGRMIGIPTANLEIDPECILPKVGVYACRAGQGTCDHRAVSNIGLRPTFTGSDALPRLETHLIDQESDLYGKTLKVAFLAHLRDEQRFSGVEALVAQIQADIRRARRLLR